MWYKEDNFSVKIGGNTYINTPTIIMYKGESIFTIKRSEGSDLLGIDFDIYGKSGKKLASVRKGRIYQENRHLYDVRVTEDQYILIDRLNNKVVCNIRKRALADDSVELDVMVQLYTKDGYFIDATPEKTILGGKEIELQGLTFTNLTAAIGIE